MPRIPVHTLENAPEPSRPPLEELAARMGRVANVHAEMAHSPAVIHAYRAINRALAEQGTLDARTREAIALAVGAVDDCEYCQAAHTLAGQRAGLTLEQTVQVRRGEVDFDQRLGTLVGVVRQVAGNRGYVDDVAWRAALDAGWSDAELTEAFAYVVANIFTNYFNHMVGTELDIAAAPALPEGSGPAQRA